MKACSSVFVVLMLCGMEALGFNPPVDDSAGFRAAISGVPGVYDVDQDRLEFSCSITNSTDRVGRVTVRVWLNDDWRVVGDARREAEVPAGETLELPFSAQPLARVLPAHYPIHAQIVVAQENQRQIELHPIAIFEVSRPVSSAPEPSEAGIAGGVYECLLTTREMHIDGDLEEWDHAVPAPCGQAQRSTGTIDPSSFDGAFYALHDDSTIYVAARIADDQISPDDVDSTDFMDSDYIRIYLSPKDPAGREEQTLGAADAVIAINVFGGHDEPLVKVPAYAGAFPPDFDLSRCRFVAVRSATGYSFEGAIPYSVFGAPQGARGAFGLNVMIGDADDGRRQGEVCLGRTIPRYWLTPQSYIRLVLAQSTEPSEQIQAMPPLVRLRLGAQRLDQLHARRHGMEQGDNITYFPPGWAGHSDASGATFRPGRATRGGIERHGFVVHPPYRGGTGPVWTDYYVDIPDVSRVVFDGHTAIRDHNPETEPPSDGVEFKLLAVDEQDRATELFRRFSASKTWEPVRVDLSRFAGQAVRLRLWAGPGPAQNTVCDAGYWADPTLVVGEIPRPVGEETWQARRDRAVRLAAEAARGSTTDRSFILRGPGSPFGAAVVLGEGGLPDSVLAFSDGSSALTFRGMMIEIDGRDCSDWRSGVRVRSCETRHRDGGLVLDQAVSTPEGDVPVQVVLQVRQGALSASFNMPEVRRDARGHPRFTRLGLGPADESLHRVYLGFGNVAEGVKAPFRVRSGGFGLSTRHVGADYANGLSLVQAVDTFPDQAVCDPAQNLFRIEAPHDSTLVLIPSSDGAFAAARHYRDLSGFRPSPGIQQLLGRMCLDQWGGDYAEAAADIELAGRYGLNHSIFVKHVWQRWGYDYRLPDIYPPAGGLEAFNRMPEACRQHGILFAPHDNYIDFYPDASGFSYDHIIFNRDGTPQRAWFNKGRQAQSYRWLPHAFMPWLERNMQLMRNGCAPTGLFIDVFSAIKVMDYYDRNGTFYARHRTQAEWREAFDSSRRILGAGAPMLSEAGHDALIGSLDGAQADHYAADRWGIDANAAVRTPWHDMASHGRFVLLAGGLGHRYGDRDPQHTYGTDDYLSNTVIGGRNPMSDGPFNRRAVMTYWLLHDTCNALAHAGFESHAFADNSVFRQHTGFSDGSQVWTNRGEKVWQTNGKRLPRYGFWVETPAAQCGVFLIGEQRAGYAASGTSHFVDARPVYTSARRRQVATEVLGGRYTGDGAFEVTVEWRVLEPLAEGTIPFVHIVHDGAGNQGERIAHYGTMHVDPARFRQRGTFRCPISATIPADSYGGTYRLRYGLFNPEKGGARVVPAGDLEDSRVRGGRLIVTIDNGNIRKGRYEAEEPLDLLEDINRQGEILDFGGIRTNGAFRLDHPSDADWLLTPLPGSLAFEAHLDLRTLGASRPVRDVLPVDPFDNQADEPVVSLEGRTLSLQLAADARAYRIRFE